MDFLQERITTIHDMCIDVETIKHRLRKLTIEKPVCLILPMLYSEIKGEGLSHIVSELSKCDFLSKVSIALAADSEDEYREVVEFFEDLQIHHSIIWCNGPKVEAVLKEVEKRGIQLSQFSGKGRDIWIAIGVESRRHYALGFHDVDIINYDQSIPTKLFYPLLEEQMDFFYNKGYYARVNMDAEQIYGRVVRLLVVPLIDSLECFVKGGSDFIDYIRSFRYPLSGEFAITSDLAENIRVPGHWGLEIGLLSEIYRNASEKRICQVDLGFYDHKHRPVDPIGTGLSEGLSKMASDICKTFFRVLTEKDALEIDEKMVRSLAVAYRRIAQDRIRQYNVDAVMNGLGYNRHIEEILVDQFSEVIEEAGKKFIERSAEPLLPDWKRMEAALPGVQEMLWDAVRDGI
ncbi:MAG: glycosyltransferase family protein [Methermicoccaceae archaeon]